MSGEPASYQKYDGASGQYQDVPEGASKSGNARKWIIGAILVAALAVVYAATGPRIFHDNQGKAASDNVEKTIASSSSVSVASNGKLKLFDSMSRYVLEDYDVKSTWTSFLPAVAGYFGKPVWVFYVNRGQGIATFGTESKDYPILEFNPANKAYQMTPYWGFRTFLTGTRGSKTFQTEPFSPANSRNLQDDEDDAKKPKRILFVGTNEMEIQEIDGLHGVTTNVQYFIVPDEDFAAMVRRTTITNSGDDALTLDILDGLAKMEPFGGALDNGLKNMGRTLEGWMGVYHADSTLTLPFYKLSTEPSDSAKVHIEEAGNYCFAFIETKSINKLLPIVFDTDKVFGKDTSLAIPQGIMASSVGEILENGQYGWAKTSSAFPAVTQYKLAPGESITISSVYGKADHIDMVPRIAQRVVAPGYITQKLERAREITNDLTKGVESSTVNKLFDGTVKQMFLDNGLRGGIPTILGNVEADTTYDEDSSVKVYHSFSRIHGDLERDYNYFKIEPTFFSQGPGNYRDIAQNRRNDVTFFPRMGSFDIQMFLSYIQADAYEPLTVEAVVFRFTDMDVAADVAAQITADDISATRLTDVLKGGAFRPGQIFSLCEELGINKNTAMTNADFINTLLEHTEDRAMGVFGAGYWGDHWDYYIDMIEAYLAVYPDYEEELMYDKPLRYFFSTATVKPRKDKYIETLTFNGNSTHVLQLDSTVFDTEKVKEQGDFLNTKTGLLGIEANWQRTGANGVPFFSSAIAKLFLLGAIKYATRDPYGMGIEYEGGRPGWLDSMNGLPGMVGSGMPETYELYLLLTYVKKVVDKYQRPVTIPDELHAMVRKVNDALDTLKSTGYKDLKHPSVDVPDELFTYWDDVATAREEYRAEVEYYFSGNTTDLDASVVSDMISDWLEQIEMGIERSFKFGTQGYGDDGTSGIPPCFFAYDMTNWKKNGGHNDVGLPTVDALAFSVKTFPLFLEGPVRYMKYVIDNKDRLKDLYERVLQSGLRDTVLNMYFLSASLEGQGFDMGRQVSFAPGWLENQSIWMHMSYKYYLQMIRGGLYEEFFAEMKGGGILPFMDPDVYGRSLMECSSFMASSAFPDPSIVGQGFLPRLSGSTAEFMDIWKYMFIGPKLFYLNDDDELEMQLVPALPNWLFEDSDSQSEPTYDSDGNHVVSFKLFATIPVTYHNPGGDNLYRVSPKSYKITTTAGKETTIDGGVIPTKLAKKIRRVKSIASIDAYF